MQILKTQGWQDYQLLDSGNSRRLEKFGEYVVSRPDPQAIWKPSDNQEIWMGASAYFEDSGKKGNWSKKDVPEKWPLSYKNVKFYAKLSPFKHTGIFPEQILNWEYMEQKIKLFSKQVNVLNLFGYTGISSLLCASLGAKVTHLDGSKPSISWAKENQELSGLSDKPIRWILDDALAFTEREVRRGSKYDAIIMDPPIYGHGPKGEIWDFNKSFPILLENCRNILSEDPVFFIVNAYAISASSLMLSNMLEDYMNFEKEKIEYGELALEEKERKRLLSTGIFARYSSV
ncbi:MAG TPA: class I SAM-dependent methyltransferase [Candidatus Sulfotelmatobacter sp.]|nr:class I SAM-dependent methyltransferase [Candidatus Sulfotelmatobacter sp.]